MDNLAWSYFLVGDSLAEETARKAYGLAPENGSVVDTLGWILVQKGELEDGIDFLRKAVDLSSDSSEIRYHLAAGLAKNGVNEEARHILDEVLGGEEGFPSRKDAEKLMAEL